jgi:hypothetical protein
MLADVSAGVRWRDALAAVKGIDQNKRGRPGRDRCPPVRVGCWLVATTLTLPYYNAFGAAPPFARCPLGVHREDNNESFGFGALHCRLDGL